MPCQHTCSLCSAAGVSTAHCPCLSAMCLVLICHVNSVLPCLPASQRCKGKCLCKQRSSGEALFLPLGIPLSLLMSHDGRCACHEGWKGGGEVERGGREGLEALEIYRYVMSCRLKKCQTCQGEKARQEIRDDAEVSRAKRPGEPRLPAQTPSLSHARPTSMCMLCFVLFCLLRPCLFQIPQTPKSAHCTHMPHYLRGG